MSFPDSLRALVWDGNAIWAFVSAAATVLVLTPLIARYAARIGGLDEGGDRPRVHGTPVPRIGGLAIVVGILIPSAILLKPEGPYLGILVGTLLCGLLGLVDDIRGLRPSAKLLGVILIALIPVAGYDVSFGHLTLPLVGDHDLGWIAYPLTVLWIATLANLVNLIDGMDALAAGMPALGFVLATVAVQGVLKTAATIALVAPLLVMAVPILDTSFVVLKRLKYGRPPWLADQNHFYHRFLRIGLSQRRTAAYLHAWAGLLAAYAILLRFVPPRPRGHWDLANTLIGVGSGLAVVAASVWMVYTLEIIKARHLQRLGLRREPAEEREEAVERALTAGRQ
jgi:UDP-GlcNAc:undecaprenyl-phosphate GlcNAc-1-phosphate transferase